MKSGKVSVVIPAHNEGENLIDTVNYILKNTDYPAYEVVVVDDNSTDGSGDRVAAGHNGDSPVIVIKADGLGVAGARNLGAQAAGGDILVFIDGHTYTPPGWLPSLIAPLTDSRVGMVGPAFADLTNNNGTKGLGAILRDASLEMDWLPQKADEFYPVPLLPGGCQVMRKADFIKIGCYDTGMTRWGSEDLEISLRAWLMGYRVVVQPQSVIYHLFRQSHPYHVESSQVIYNRLRMALLHFSEERTARVFDYYKGIPEFGQVMLRLMESDTMEQRKQFREIRSRDDCWYFEQFGCPF
ncbi:MAG: hypothetical protein CVU89_06660 [Firmicutes bacterium HGW-Firmicutes-14]|nr:MAG: hypothetical protein CVU89_06660 [Firmicutes bacterium HGW-Firmicutes-14]